MSVGELEITRRISLVAVCCSSASVSSRVRASTLRSRPAYDSWSAPVIWLNWSASSSSSSPVSTAMRWTRSPAAMRPALDWSTLTGRTTRRARTRLTATDRPMPRSTRTAVRAIEARIGANASASGCSTMTNQPSGSTGADAASTDRPCRSWAIGVTFPARAIRTCSSPERSAFFKTRLMSGWAMSWPRPSTTNAWPALPMRIWLTTSQMNLRFTSATVTGAGAPAAPPPLGIATVM